MQDWIPIFRTGTHHATNGYERIFTEADLDKTVSLFNPAHHEPPVVIGHPKNDAPAFGWVKGVKREGQVLYAKVKEVVPEFAEMVQKGLFKKRSAAFYPDLSLRHVGFLGAAPPAVKGLADISFAGENAVTYEFMDRWQQQSIADLFRGIREWIIEKFGRETADSVVPDWAISNLAPQPEPTQTGQTDTAFGEEPQSAIRNPQLGKEAEKMNLKAWLSRSFGRVPDGTPDVEVPGLPDTPPPISFSEAEVQTRETAAAEKAKKEARDEAAREFAEQQKRDRIAQRKAEIIAFCDALCDPKKGGRFNPARIKLGLPLVLEFLAASDDVLEFGEAKEKKSPYDLLKAQFESDLPWTVSYSEHATRDKDVGGAGDAGKKLSELTRQKMEAQKLSYAEAFTAVQREHPDLALEYAEEIRPKK